jgi:hypothetical protein
MSDSRFIKYDKRNLPKEKRTIPVWGADLPDAKQSDTFFRCWNCLFVCNVDRDEVGDGVGYVVIDEVRKKNVRLNAGIRELSLSIDRFQSGAHLMQLDPSGNPVTVMHNFTQKVFSGCPGCGCKNYK